MLGHAMRVVCADQRGTSQPVSIFPLDQPIPAHYAVSGVLELVPAVHVQGVLNDMRDVFVPVDSFTCLACNCERTVAIIAKRVN